MKFKGLFISTIIILALGGFVGFGYIADKNAKINQQSLEDEIHHLKQENKQLKEHKNVDINTTTNNKNIIGFYKGEYNVYADNVKFKSDGKELITTIQYELQLDNNNNFKLAVSDMAGNLYTGTYKVENENIILTVVKYYGSDGTEQASNTKQYTMILIKDDIVFNKVLLAKVNSEQCKIIKNYDNNL